MKLSVCIGLAVAATANASTTHPMEAVVLKLEELSRTNQEDGKTDETNFARMDQAKRNAILNHNNKIKTLTDNIENYEIEIKGLEAKIESIDDKITETNDELGELSAQDTQLDTRKTASDTAYTKASGDLDDTIQAVSSALQGLKDAVAAPTMFMQVQKAWIATSPIASEEQKAIFDSFLQQPIDSNRVVDSKSGGIINMLKDLQTKFEAELAETEKMQTASTNAHTLAKKANKDQQDAASAALANYQSQKGDAETAKTTAEGALVADKQSKDDETTARNLAQKNLTENTDSFEERAKMRSDESTAIHEAIWIISASTGIQDHSVTKAEADFSFIQISKESPIKKAVKLIEAAAAKSSKKVMIERVAQELSVVSSKKGSSEGMFKKVLEQIYNLITSLNAEQQSANEKFGWCVEKRTENANAREKNHKNTQATDAKKSQLEADIGALKTTIEGLDDDIEENERETQEDKDEWAAAKKTNEKTIVDAKEGQAALKQAITVLVKHFVKSGMVSMNPSEATDNASGVTYSVSGADGTATSGGASAVHTGSSGSTAVLSLLEDTLAAYSTQEAEVTASNEQQAKSFEDEMRFNKEQHADLTSKHKNKTLLKEETEAKLKNTVKRLKELSDEKHGLDNFMKDLHIPCGKDDEERDVADRGTLTEFEDDKKAQDDDRAEAKTKLQDAYDTLKTFNDRTYDDSAEIKLAQQSSFLKRA